MGVGARSKIDSVEQGRGGTFDGPPGISSFRDRLYKCGALPHLLFFYNI